MLRLIYRLFLSLFFGLILTVWVVQNNSQVEHIITHKLITLLEKEWHVSISAQSARVNFFTCSVFLNNGKVIDKDDAQCQWSFEQTRVHINPFAYLFNKEIHLYVKINNITAKTALKDGQLNLVNHIKKITAHKSLDIPLSICLVRLNNFDITLNHPLIPIRLLLTGFFELNKNLDGSIVVDNLDAFVNQKLLFHKMHGSCSLKKDLINDDWIFKLTQQLSNPIFDPIHKYMLTGIWSSGKREFELKEKSGTTLTCTLLPKNIIKLQGKLPAQIALNLGNFFAQAQLPPNIKGQCSLAATISTNNPLTESTGTLAFDGLEFKEVPIKHIELTIASINPNKPQAQITIEQSDSKILDGKICWDVHKKCGYAKLSNPQIIKPFEGIAQQAIPLNWMIKPRHLVVTADFGSNPKFLSGTYKLVMLNQNIDNHLAINGDYTVAHDEITLEGKTSRGDYSVVFPYDPHAYLKQWTYIVNQKKLINLQATKNRLLKGSVHFSLIRSFFEQRAQRLILGNQASVFIAVDQTNFSHIKGSFALHGGKIYIPESRNLIEHMASSFECDFVTKFFALNNAHIDFCRGRVECKKASVLFDDSYNIKMIHIPLTMNNLFVNWKRDFYGFIYGNLLLNKLPESDLNISGTIVLKKSLLKDNIFSQGTETLSPSSLTDLIPINQRLKVDIHVMSEQPIRARLAMLRAYANLDLRICYAHGQNIAQFPQLTGAINLENGYVKLPGNKLKIEYGKIQFITNQLNDPMIDLVASNRINKYIVTLQATGSLQKPTIILESTPELTEEQIFGLLFAGSENATLQTDLIAMLQLKLRDIVLGSKDKLPKASSFLAKLARPLKYVQITPDFTDQSGRGGIRGTIAANITDQLHAKIQKNFNMQEDFSAEVEYFLADDVSIKAIKDQRGEMGAEVEVRLKL